MKRCKNNHTMLDDETDCPACHYDEDMATADPPTRCCIGAWDSMKAVTFGHDDRWHFRDCPTVAEFLDNKPLPQGYNTFCMAGES